MSVIPSNLRIYGSADMPEADGSTVGGAVDFSKKPVFTDLAAADTVDYVSSSTSDTATKVEVQGRDSTGAIQTETKTLTGQTKVAGSQTFERLLAAAQSNAGSGGPIANPGGTTAVGDVAILRHTSLVTGTAQTGAANSSGVTPALFKLQAGQGASVAVGDIILTTGGTGPNQLAEIVDATNYGTDVVAVDADWGTIPSSSTTYEVHQGMLMRKAPNAITACVRIFSTATAQAAGGSNLTFYEKLFYVNDNTATALTVAQVILNAIAPSLPSGATLEFGLCKALNDTATSTNRQTLPTNGDSSAITFTTGSPPQSQNVPSPQNLPSGAAPNSAGAQGFWMELTLNAGTAPWKGSATMRATGSTT